MLGFLTGVYSQAGDIALPKTKPDGPRHSIRLLISWSKRDHKMNIGNCITFTGLTALEIVAYSGALGQWIDKSLTGSLSGAGWAFFFCGIAMIHFFLSDVGKASSTHTVSQSGPLAQEKKLPPTPPICGASAAGRTAVLLAAPSPHPMV